MVPMVITNLISIEYIFRKNSCDCHLKYTEELCFTIKVLKVVVSTKVCQKLQSS